MPGRGKHGKPNPGFPPFPPPLEIANSAISTFPQLLRRAPLFQKPTKPEGRGKVEIPNGGIPTFPPPRGHLGSPSAPVATMVRCDCGAYGSLRHPRKERTLGPLEASAFMLISHWNRFWISCSSLDWKMLRRRDCGGYQGTWRLVNFRPASATAGLAPAPIMTPSLIMS